MNEIGSRIRALRSRQNRTQREIAEAGGYTKSLLCKIEKGEHLPTVATLAKIAQALGVKTSVLLGEGQDDRPHYEQAAATAERLPKTAKGYSFHAFAANWTNKVMQPYFFTARKGGVRPGSLSHPGEEFIYILEGTVRYRVGAVEHLLKKGDSLYFNSAEEHDFSPVSAVVKFLAVFVDQLKE